jgi:rhodanese-related sulfurtransferase
MRNFAEYKEGHIPGAVILIIIKAHPVKME